MSRRQRELHLSQTEVPQSLLSRLRPPALIALGSPAEVAHLVGGVGGSSGTLRPTCWQMDLYQADRLRAALLERNLTADVVASPDLWDIPAPEGAVGFQTVAFLPTRGGERELKLDVIEQAFHALRPGGLFLVWSSYESDAFFAPQLKKVFGKVHVPAKEGSPTNVLWCARDGDRPRRRHEVTFQVKIGDGPSCRFVSRPGTFSYGKFDLGARALCEVMEIESGDRVLDLGCGVGTNGVFASRRAGKAGHVAFVDSNLRAVALSEFNARTNGVPSYATFASTTAEGPLEDSFDVVLANPPYFANSSVAHLFIRRAKKMLTPQGKFFMVTRQPGEVGDAILETFEEADAVVNRGYTILCV